MKAMIFAAGLGKRLRPYTFLQPKPLMPIGNSTLIERLLAQSADADIRQWVINVGYLGKHIQQHLGDGSRYGGAIEYLHESPDALLNTGSSIVAALPLLGSNPFAVISGDIYTEESFFEQACGISTPHVWLTDQHPARDFGHRSGILTEEADLAYANMGVFTADFFDGFLSTDGIGLGNIIRRRLGEKQSIAASLVEKTWSNISTPQDYRRLLHEYSTASECT